MTLTVQHALPGSEIDIKMLKVKFAQYTYVDLGIVNIYFKFVLLCGLLAILICS